MGEYENILKHNNSTSNQKTW